MDRPRIIVFWPSRSTLVEQETTLMVAIVPNSKENIVVNGSRKISDSEIILD